MAEASPSPAAGGLSLGWTLTIALGGGVLFFICLSYILASIAEHRHRLRDTSDVEVCETNQLARRKLTKSRSNLDSPNRSRQSLPHILPPIPVLHRSASFSVFSSRKKNPRRNNSWIDEDAIHGPKVKKQTEGKRSSIRNSWLMTAPTLPDLLGYKDEPEPFYRHNNYPMMAPRPVATPIQLPQTASVPLMRSQSYELAEKRAAAARGSVSQAPQGPRAPPVARLRECRTESELADILRSTAQRLQDGSPSPRKAGTRHHRTPVSSPTKGANASPTKTPGSMRSENSTGTMVVRRLGTPNHQRPQNLQPQTPTSHERKVSQSSVNSDADSLFGETTLELDQITAGGLSSPSRKSSEGSAERHLGRRVSIVSMTSQVSSSLSTLYSVDEPDDDKRTEDGKRSESAGRYLKRLGISQGLDLSDPFVSSSSITLPPLSPIRHSISLSPPRRQSQESLPLGQISGNLQSSTGSPIAKSSGSPEERDNQGLSIVLQAPAIPEPTDVLRPKSVSTMKPVFFPSSTSIVSMAASPSTPENKQKGKGASPVSDRVRVVPPPLNLRPTRSSPITAPNGEFIDMSFQIPSLPFVTAADMSTIFYRSDSADDILSLPSSPPPNRPLPDPSMLAIINNPKTLDPMRYKRPRSNYSPLRAVSGISDTSSCYEHDNGFARSETGSPEPLSLVLRSSGTVKKSSPMRESQTSGLQSAVAELRRMNSQLSTYSIASTISDTPSSPTLPALRGGGFSPERSNSRVSKAASRNYLSLGGTGSPSPKSKHVRRSSRLSRDSFSPNKRRTGSILRLDLPGSMLEMEKENNDQTMEQSKGPRPLCEVQLTRQSPTRGSLKNSRNSDSPTRRLTVKFGEVKEFVYVGEQNIVDRPSIDSVGLYDEDGFLASSPGRIAAANGKLYDKDGFLVTTPDRAGAKKGKGLRI